MGNSHLCRAKFHRTLFDREGCHGWVSQSGRLWLSKIATSIEGIVVRSAGAVGVGALPGCVSAEVVRKLQPRGVPQIRNHAIVFTYTHSNIGHETAARTRKAES